MYQNEWFHGRDAVRQLPQECIQDCSGSGDRTADIQAWVKRLKFDGPAWLFREHLKEYGCWDSTQLGNHQDNCERVLWIWACECAEYPGEYDYLHLGV